MRPLTFILLLALITSCRTHKELQTDKTAAADSVALSEYHRSIATVDSLMRKIDFRFDTLKINIERPVVHSDTPEIIHLTATNGRIKENRNIRHNRTTTENYIDSARNNRSASELSLENSTQKNVYDPPDGTSVTIVALILISMLIYLFLRKKR